MADASHILARCQETFTPSTRLFLAHNYGLRNYLWTQDLLMQIDSQLKDDGWTKQKLHEVGERVSTLLDLKARKAGSFSVILEDEYRTNLFFLCMDVAPGRTSEFTKVLKAYCRQDDMDEVGALTFLQQSKQQFN